MLLKAHIDAVENSLLATSKIPANSGHTLHKGTPREAFIKEFLEGHLSEKVAIGTGEILNANSKPNERRNQIDIVLYKRDYPRIQFGGGICGFLVESVVATIEVKSILTKSELQTAIQTAHNLKHLERNITTSFYSGYQPPSILSYLVAYDGPANMATVHDWITSIHSSSGISYPAMGRTIQERRKVAAPSLDGIFVLGKGFIQFDNGPVYFFDDTFRADHPSVKWFIADTPSGNLLLLFLSLTQAVSGVSGSWLDVSAYFKDYKFDSWQAGG